jgi:very-short-patch-repair endonuclease
VTAPDLAAIDAEQRRIKALARHGLETDLERQILAAGLGQPAREWRFHPPRRWRFDLCFPLEWLAIEVDGGTWKGGRHNRGAGYESDCEKYAQALVDGWRVLRVTANMVKDGRALGYVRAALAPAGEERE